MIRQFFIILVTSVSIAACAQSKTVIKKSYSFYTEKLPGTIKTNPGDEAPEVRRDTIITVYIESPVKNITWDSAWQNGKAYLVITQLISSTPLEAGISKSGNKKIMIKPSKGNYLWQLYLQPIENLKKGRKTLNNNQILLRGDYKRKPIFRQVGSPVALESIPSV